MVRRDGSYLRVLDANLNRAREGLRVCEEVARLVLNDPSLTHAFQQLRYALDDAARPFPAQELLRSRNSRSDVGHPGLRGRVRPHKDLKDLSAANIRRVQEAFRVLEEFTRLRAPKASRSFGSLRFRTYTLEQAFLNKL